MNRFDRIFRSAWSLLIVGAFAFALAGCEGDDGATGPAGPAGPAGQDGQDGQDASADPIALAKAEACATCHGGTGEDHQAVYDLVYNDPSKLTLTINSVSSVDEGGGASYTVTVGFGITMTGEPSFDAGNDLTLLDEGRFYAVQYDSLAAQYLNSETLFRLGRTGNWNLVSNGDGTYVLTTTGVAYAPEAPSAPFDGAQVYGYIAAGPVVEHEAGTGAEIPVGSHVHLYDNVANAAFPVGTAAFGDVGAYQSAANVAGCEKCHGEPYLKHGFRAAAVEGLPAFAACKSCHYDNRAGGHEDWQYMVDEPFLWATAGLTVAEVEARYGYTANIMNDVHMSHAMEFPYPQSMQNCDTCHAGKLDTVLADENFTAETCLSCHPAVGTDAWPKTWDANGNEILDRRGNSVPEIYGQPNRAPALDYLWFVADAEFTFHTPDANCYICHGDPVEGFASTFRELHTGYDVNITNAGGERYADLYTVSIDGITLAGNLLTVDFIASDTGIVPELLVSFYGWDSKQYIVASHTRDANRNRMEYVPETVCIAFELEDDPADCANPLFTEDPASTLGDWRVTLDMAAYAPIPQLPDDIPTMIADGRIKKVEVTVTPELNLANLAVPGEDLDVVLRADNETFDLIGTQIIDDYFKGANAIVSTDKCNVCHDALASSFHSESGRDGDGIEICKNCHVTTNPGSHIEMASRAIDNYVHAIHTFQAFDVADQFNGEDANEDPIAQFDPVLAKRYDMHIKHVFPNFTIRNCEACHVTAGDPVDPLDPDGPKFPVVYNVPDQSKSMPGVASRSDNPLTWYDIVSTSGEIPSSIADENSAGRNIGSIPELVSGPASRACGGCHRARLVRDDAAGDLASFDAHVESGGTLAENDSDDFVVYGIIDKIMSMFE